MSEEGGVGVGPWPGSWPAGEHYDPALLEHGDRRNVVDRYRYWRLEAIAADLAARSHGFHVAVENLQHDFNIGSIVRSANAFGAGGVHIVGRRRWNRRGAMVTDRYLDIHHHDDPAALRAWADDHGLTVVGIENGPGSGPVELRALPRGAMLVFGQEGPGLSPGLQEVCDTRMSIAQFGSTRSINVGAAAAVAMHAWVRQWALIVDEADPDDPGAGDALRAYRSELADVFPGGFDGRDLDLADLIAPRGTLLLAHLGGSVVGCGGLHWLDDDVVEIKRMWLDRSLRGHGFGRALLTALEDWSREHGRRVVRLDTNGALTAALALYRSSGYREIERYNTNPFAEHWFEKAL